MRPESHSKPSDAAARSLPVQLRLGERIDPDGADALWSVVFGPEPGTADGAEGGDRRPGQDAEAGQR